MRSHQLSASVLAAFDLKELPDLSYGCPSTQQQGIGNNALDKSMPT